jgi:hypothetical protein
LGLAERGESHREETGRVKYINHLTASGSDDKHVALIEEHGVEGYGAYWLLAEEIGSQITPDNLCTKMRKPWRKWAETMCISTKKCQKTLKTMASLKLISLTFCERWATIDMPNLLKYADNYISKSVKSRT